MSKRKHKRRKPPKKRKIVKRNSQQSAMSRFHNDATQNLGDDVIIVESELRMSEVIGDFISPYADDMETVGQYEKLVTIAAMAWNSAILPPEARDLTVEQMLKSIPTGVEDGLVDFFDELLARKRQYFSHINRIIVNYEVTELDDGEWYLAVASILSNEEVAEYEAQQNNNG